MENTESNLKPQQTGGLKLMTVFVVVLALHVVVIGGMTTYYLLKGGSADTSLTDDKNHKGLKANADGSLVAESTLPDADKTTPAPATDASTTTASTSTPSTTPAPDQTAPSDATPASTAPVTPTTTAASTPSALTPPPDVTAPPVVTKSTPVVSTPDIKTSSAVTTPVPVTRDVTQMTPAPTATGGTPYTVVSHDSLAKIAHKNHISVTNLMAANSLNSDKLSIGQKLVIPAKAPAAAVLGTTEALAPATPTTDVATTTTPPVAPVKETASAPVTEKKVKAVATAKPVAAKSATDKHTYTIVKGDTLTKIAHKFKTTPTALMAANNITDPTKLKIGNKLMIPAKEAHTATVTSPAPVQPAQVETKKAAAQLANVIQ